MRCVGGYGPYETDIIERKKSFWDKLSIEVDAALEYDAGFILQMDGYLWAGENVIKGDPTRVIQMESISRTF